MRIKEKRRGARGEVKFTKTASEKFDGI